MTSSRREFRSAEIAELLGELDRRLREREVRAAVFVVGGAAMAARHTARARVTQDVDALTTDSAVAEEARMMAKERGLPPDWLNSNAAMWMPPLPPGALDPPDQPGLRVTYADDGFLFATKLLSQRAKDADDLVALAERLDMTAASADELETHIRRYDTDTAMLEFVVSGSAVDEEVRLLAEDAARMLQRHALGES